MSSRIKGLVKWYNESLVSFHLSMAVKISRSIARRCVVIILIPCLKARKLNMPSSIEMTKALPPPMSYCAINNDL